MMGIASDCTVTEIYDVMMILMMISKMMISMMIMLMIILMLLVRSSGIEYEYAASCDDYSLFPYTTVSPFPIILIISNNSTTTTAAAVTASPHPLVT